ncbi:filamentous haemagglutinin family outer membrane protein associated with VreARI signalling system [Blastochloris viridis]|uniref:Filamentous haemagglutinin family outer membrane protein associated with VreARI signalling system n=1 Tax=Blastochloris viridis TaxID=1079 RepID=A0A182D5M3_BLAVI|nr:filamentous haemagglutinin family outer membrane protein associated with VreARI signalling system [Blastochloris viridis]
MAAAVAAQQAAAAQAAASTVQAQASLARAAGAMQAIRRSQAAASALAAQSPSSIPDGLRAGGLMPDPNIAADPSLWQNATLPTERLVNGRTLVDVTQTQSKAILNWQTFNVGRNTTLTFNQDAADWTVLNRIDASIGPSTILGQINAKGGVYVINRNGIIFGAGAQINVHALVASTLDVGALTNDRVTRDNFFLTNGIANAKSFSIFDPTASEARYTSLGGDVRVEAGASITTSIVDLDSPGFVYLFAKNVSNAGSITVPAGEAAMVSGLSIELVPNGFSLFPTAVVPSGSTFRGTEFRIGGFPYLNPNGAISYGFPSGTGVISNSGLIETPRGIVAMTGDRVTFESGGVISADTSISRNSMVLVHAVSSIDMNGTISMLPFDDGNTLPIGGTSNGSVQSFTPAYVEMTAQTSVTLGSSGLISAPSAAVNLRQGGGVYQVDSYGQTLNGTMFLVNPSTSIAIFPNNIELPGRVLLSPGATIDVAGLQDVTLPVSYNFIKFQPRAEFADMPLQRDGALYGQTLWIDIRATGTRSDGTTWVGTPLADASGVVGAVGRSIYQLMTAGGTVSLGTETGENLVNGVQYNYDVVLQSGAVINLAGGSVKFIGGKVPVTWLVGADRRLYNMQNADPNRIYLGVAGSVVLDHAHWNITETYTSPLFSSRYEPGYSEGRDAGGLTITTATPYLAGNLLFGSVAGERQILSGRAPSDKIDYTSGSAVGRLTPLQASGDELPSQGYLKLVTRSAIVIDDDTQSLPADFDPDTVLRIPATPDAIPSANFQSVFPFGSAPFITARLSSETLSSYGLSLLDINARSLVLAADNSVRLAAGGAFSVLTSGAIDIAGNVSAAGGRISLSTDVAANKISLPTDVSGDPAYSKNAAGYTADIFVGGTLDVSGRWVNDFGHADADLAGPGYIDGGSITISTSKRNFENPKNDDASGSIRLATGSLLDASGGGYISQRGVAKTTASGVMAGKGGSISLLLYQGTTDWYDPEQLSIPTRPQHGSLAAIVLDGTLRAYGFQQNGTLRLGGADTIRIGGVLQPGERSAFWRNGQNITAPLDLLTGGGFGAIVLETLPDGYSKLADGSATPASIIIATDLTLQQRNLSSVDSYLDVGTGTKIATAAALVTLPDDQRSPVDLTLKANNILLDTGARIVTDPKATIRLAGSRILKNTPDVAKDQRAASVRLLGSIIDHGGTVAINALKTVLGSQASIDLSGLFIANSRFGEPGGPATSGTLLPGGTFAVEAAQPLDALVFSSSTGVSYNANPSLSGSSVMAETGAVVDVSGTAGVIEVLDDHRTNASTPLWSWSDAGTVSVDASAFLWGGTLKAAGGDPRANNGTIILGGGSVRLTQDAQIVTATTSPGALIVAAANQLAAFDNIFLYAGSSRGGAARIFTDLATDAFHRPVDTYGMIAPTFYNLVVDDNLNASFGSSRLHIAASTISSLAPGSNSNASINAAYVLLTGGGGTTAGGSSALTISGRTIDIEGAAFNGFGRVSFKSAGDIRFSTPKVANGVITVANTLAADNARFAGSLALQGQLWLQAQRIYPVSAVDFTIDAGATGSVTFAKPAASRTDIPLSAAGTLTVSAAQIEQDGNLFAPLGKITLGVSGTTQTVTLGAGSLTSVTLADTTVPYGETPDGTNWYYNASDKPLAQPPSKGLVLAGAVVNVSAGSTIDVRGGGDLQAMQFIEGTGGSRDVLATATTGQSVYALVPAYNDSVAAFDVHFTVPRARTVKANGAYLAAQTPLDSYPLVGTQITIDGGNGIPAGTYTLYPAHYATLPGALRVVYYGDNVVRNIASGTTLPDGTVLVTGHYGSSLASVRQSSGEGLFAVQTGAVWQQYSEYEFNRANSYFAEKAAHDGVSVPRLPIDAGRLATIAQQQLLLLGRALTLPAPGGRGSELDLSSSKIAVLGHEQFVRQQGPAGYASVDVTQLNEFGFESVLVGGLRSDTTTGTLITPTANYVEIDTGGAAFTAPEILLVAAPEMDTVTSTLTVGSGAGATTVIVKSVTPKNNGSGLVTIKAGSVIRTQGEVHLGYGRNYYFASSSDVTPASIAAALGGTLDSTGTQITGASLLKLQIYLANTNAQWNPTLAQPSLSTLGALFAASNDSSLVLRGPAGDRSSPLTVSFANLASTTYNGKALSGVVTGTVALPASDLGKVVIEGGASIDTGTMTVQATQKTGAIILAPTATFRVNQMNLAARSIGLEAVPSTGRTESLLLATAGSQFAAVQGLTLRAMTDAITSYGDVVFDPGAAMQRLTLDARTIAGTGGNATFRVGGSVSLVNTGSASSAAVSGVGGTLDLEASEIVLGGGNQTIAGFANVKWSAGNRVVVAAPGTLTLGVGTDTVGLNVTTPNILVAGATGSGDNFVLTTLGNATLTRPAGAAAEPPATSEFGGNFTLAAASISDNATIQAQAGTLTLHATSGDVTLGANARIAAGGYKVSMLDADIFVAGGKVVLQADAGNVSANAGSIIDVAQSEAQGYGGEIDVLATAGRAVLLGELRGQGGPGLGGRLKVDANALQVDAAGIDPQGLLDPLADRLLTGGFSGSIDIRSRTGNLTLSQGHTLKANAVVLTADGLVPDPSDSTKQIPDTTGATGNLTIAGTINADGYAGKTADGTGQAGGQVGLFGGNSVTLKSTGQILARTGGSDAVLDPGSHALPSKVVWFNNGTGADTVAFSSSGRYTSDGGATYHSFAAGQAFALPPHSAVLLDLPGSVTVAGHAPVAVYQVAHDDERGGDVTIGTRWSAVGNIDLQSDQVGNDRRRSLIDVSGGIKGGLLGGTVTLRAPLDGHDNAKIAALDASIAGARAVNIQAFASFNTEASPNNVNGLDGSSLRASDGTPVKWDGYIDPAGTASPTGGSIDFGTWTGLTGQQLTLTPGTGYTSVPVVVLTRGGSNIGVPTPQTVNGVTYYDVTDPVTGTTFRPSLQVRTISVGTGGVYDSRPIVQISQPQWGAAPVLTVNMGFNALTFPSETAPVGTRVYLYNTDQNGNLVLIGSSNSGNSYNPATRLFTVNNISVNATYASTLTKLPDQLRVCSGNLSACGNASNGVYYSTGIGGTLKVTSITVAANYGYTSLADATLAFSGGGANPTQATTSVVMGAALNITGVTKGYTGTNLPTVALSGGGGSSASASFAAVTTTTLNGTSSQATDGSYLFVPTLTSFIPSASSRVFGSQYTGDNAATLTLVANAEHQKFYTDVLANFVEGKGISGIAGYKFDGLFAKLYDVGDPTTLVGRLGSIVHVQPGIDLVNNPTTPAATNNFGNITVVSNWNLAAGTVGNTQTATYLNNSGAPIKNPTTQVALGSYSYFDPNASYVNFIYRLATPWGGFEPGALTLRTAGDINVNASISDGFFQFGDYLDSNYNIAVQANISLTTARGVGFYDYPNAGLVQGRYSAYLNDYHTTLAAPYKAVANAVSPGSADLTAADLFPNALRVCTTDCSAANLVTITNPGSWSYGVVAGADVSSANPNAVVPLLKATSGNVIIDKHQSYAQPLFGDISIGGQAYTASVNFDIPTMVRTGTGNIDVFAARDVQIKDIAAPGVIYAAGVNTARLSPAYIGSAATPTLADPLGDGFLEPQVLAYSGVSTTRYYGPPTAAAFPYQGGDLDIEAQQDIIGYSGSTDGRSVYQYFKPWLLSQTELTPAEVAAAGTITTRGQGAFAPTKTRIASQTAWWIQYGSFQQGFLSAGGNATVIAGRDLKGVSVSLPTTGRVSGGLTATSTPVTHIYDSGNMLVRAGRDILGGAFYEGSGHASIVAGRAVGQNGTIVRSGSTAKLPDLPLLAVDLGRIAMQAGSVSIAGVINPAELHVQSPSQVNPNLHVSTTLNYYTLFMDTYGPDSAASITALTGDLLISPAPTSGAQTYPASFEAVALAGNIVTTGIGVASSNRMPGIVLSGSEHGTFSLLAAGSIDLTFGYQNGTSNSYRPFISAGPSLLDKAFDPFRPNAWADTHDGDASYAGAVSAAVLAHQDDAELGIDTTARIYAMTGSIKAAGAFGSSDGKTIFQQSSDLYQGGYTRVEINRPARIYAGTDIIDLNLIVQNIADDSVSTVIAGRDISYTGWNNAGGLQIAGPGFFVVEAGRDLGPFLPAAHDTAAQVTQQQGIVSVANNSTTPVGNIYISSTVYGRIVGSIGLYDPVLQGGYSSTKPATMRNPLLSRTGAELLIMFGVAPPLPAGSTVARGPESQIDYQAVINTYINPAQASLVEHNYLGELKIFLARIGRPAASDGAAWDAFNALPLELRHVFVDQVFFAELKAVGLAIEGGVTDYQRGYRMVNTMFPAELGYTQNALGGGSNGANALKHWGDLEMFHGTIQTQLGGDISIFGPSGSMRVGQLASETNPKLKLRDIGILSLGVGAINTFTDQDVLVNSSRVLTTQGGDVLMWSSNGDLDAGRGSKTTLSFPPLQAIYDPDDYQSVDLGGYVSGAGIGVLKTSKVARKSKIFLLAPRGTIDAGTAGIRVSGNAVVAAVTLLNASNIEVGGKATGLPTIQGPSVSGLAAAISTPPPPQPVATAINPASDRSSIIIVEILGYGGSDGSPNSDRPTDEQRRRTDDGRQGSNQQQDPRSRYQVIGVGELTDAEARQLTEMRRQAVGR